MLSVTISTDKLGKQNQHKFHGERDFRNKIQACAFLHETPSWLWIH